MILCVSFSSFFFRIPFEVLVHLELCELTTFEKVLNVRITQAPLLRGYFQFNQSLRLFCRFHSFSRELVFG